MSARRSPTGSPRRVLTPTVQVGAVVVESRRRPGSPAQSKICSTDSAIAQQLKQCLADERAARQKETALWAEEWDELNRQLELRNEPDAEMQQAENQMIKESDATTQRVQSEYVSALKAKAEAQELMIQQISGLQAKNDNLEKELLNQRSLSKFKLESERNKHLQELADVEQRFEIERVELQKKLSEAQAELSGLTGLKAEIDAFQQEVLRVKAEQNSLQEMLQNNSTKFETAHVQLADATQKRIADAAVFVASLEDRLAGQTDEVQKYKVVVQERGEGTLQRQLAEAADHIADLEYRLSTEQACTGVLQEKMFALVQDKEAALKTQAEEFRREQEQLTNRLSNLEAERKNMQWRLDEADTRIEEADKAMDLTSLRRDLDILNGLGAEASQREAALLEQLDHEKQQHLLSHQKVSEELAESKRQILAYLDHIRTDAVVHAQLTAENSEHCAMQQKLSKELAESRDLNSALLERLNFESQLDAQLDADKQQQHLAVQQKLSEDLAESRRECLALQGALKQTKPAEAEFFAVQKNLSEELIVSKLEISSLEEHLRSETALNMKFHSNSSDHLAVNKRLTEELAEHASQRDLLKATQDELFSATEELATMQERVRLQETELLEQSSHAKVEQLVQKTLAEELALNKKEKLTLQQGLDDAMGQIAKTSKEKNQAFAQMRDWEEQLFVLRQQATELHQELATTQDIDHVFGNSAPGSEGNKCVNQDAEKLELLQKRTLERVREQKKSARERDTERPPQREPPTRRDPLSASLSASQRRQASLSRRARSPSPRANGSGGQNSSPSSPGGSMRAPVGSPKIANRTSSPKDDLRPGSTGRRSIHRTSGRTSGSPSASPHERSNAPGRRLGERPEWGARCGEPSDSIRFASVSQRADTRSASSRPSSRQPPTSRSLSPKSNRVRAILSEVRTLASEIQVAAPSAADNESKFSEREPPLTPQSSPGASDGNSETSSAGGVGLAWKIPKVAEGEGQRRLERNGSTSSASSSGSVKRAVALINSRPAPAAPPPRTPVCYAQGLAQKGLLTPLLSRYPSGSAKSLHIPLMPTTPPPEAQPVHSPLKVHQPGMGQAASSSSNPSPPVRIRKSTG